MTGSRPVPRAGQPKARWWLPSLIVLMAILGAGCLAAAACIGPGADSSARAAAPSEDGSAGPQSGSQGSSATIPAAVTGPDANTPVPAVSELADPGWVARTAEATGIPDRALAAYAGAAMAIRGDQPSCGLGWNTLAAIGLVESGHGSINGARLASDGQVSPRIVGIALDGSTTDTIPDTDDGSLDADPEWDRAVGPMQFIPSTWAGHASDGNGDGQAEVNQIDDAALTAAKYLCASARDLTQPADWITAIAAYNRSAEYNQRVAEAATQYARTGGAPD